MKSLPRILLAALFTLAVSCAEETVAPPPAPRAAPGLPCIAASDCDPWETCKDQKCAPVGCLSASECPEAGQQCINGACARARATFCVQTERPSPPCESELAMDFGSLLLSQSDDRTLSISNTGNAPLTVAGVRLVDAPAHSDFLLSVSGVGGASGPWTLAPGQDLVAAIHYQPTDATPDSAHLLVSTDDPDALLVDVPVISDIKGEEQVTPAPAALDFGYVDTNSDKTLVLAIQNSGTSTSVLEVKEILSGHASFHAAPRSPLKQFLEVGQQLLVDVTYRPEVDELVESSLKVRTNDRDEPERVVPARGFSNAKLLFITSTCPPRATQGRAWKCTLPLTDGTYLGPTWTWSMETKPSGMTLAGDGSSATLVWTPGGTQLGANPVTVKVVNPRGGVARQTFAVDVIGLFTLSAVSPMVASACGGTDLVLSGTNLHPYSKVTFTYAGSTPAVAPLDVAPSQKGGALVVSAPQLPTGGFYHLTIVSLDDSTNRSELASGLLATPEILGAAPEEAPIGENITFSGCGLSTNGTVWVPTTPFGGPSPTVKASSSANELSVRLAPEAAAPFMGGVGYVKAEYAVSNPWPVSVTGQPRALSVASVVPAAGERAVITGNGFDGSTAANNHVRFWVRASPTDAATQLEATITLFSPTSLTVFLPETAVTGPVEVTVGGKTAKSPRAFPVAGSVSVPSVLGMSYPSLFGTRVSASGSAIRVAVFGSGFGADAASVAVTAVGADRVPRAATVKWASDRALVADLGAVSPMGGVTIEVRRGGALLGAARATRINVAEYFAHGGALPDPLGEGLPPQQASLWNLVPTMSAACGALVFLDSDRVRVFNQTGARGTFYGKTVGTGEVRTVYKSTSIRSIAVDPQSCDLYVAPDFTLLRISVETGAVTTLIEGREGNNTGRIADASLLFVRAIAFAPGGLVYLADGQNPGQGVRLANFGPDPVTRHGVTVEPAYIRTVSGTSGLWASIAVGPYGDLYVVTTSNHVNLVPRESSAAVQVLRSAGDAAPVGENADASSSTVGGAAHGLAMGADGSLYTGTSMGIVRRLRPSLATGIVDNHSLVDTVAGDWRNQGFSGDNTDATAAGLSRNTYAGIDAEGNLLVAGGCRLRKVSAGTGRISTLVGSGCYLPADGSNAKTIPYAPRALAVDGSNSDTLYTADPSNGVLWRINPAGAVRALAALGEIYGLALQGGKLYALQVPTPRIYQVDLATGAATVVAGTGVSASTGDGGTATLASLRTTVSMYSGAYRYLSEAASELVVFSEENRVRALNPTDHAVTAYGVTLAPGAIDRIAGGGTGQAEGSAGRSQSLSYVVALALQPSGDLLLADAILGRVFRLSVQDGTLRTLVGPPRPLAAVKGIATFGQRAAEFGTPYLSVASDRFGNLLLVGSHNSYVNTSVVVADANGEITPDSPVIPFLTTIGQPAVLGRSYLFQSSNNPGGTTYRFSGVP